MSKDATSNESNTVDSDLYKINVINNKSIIPNSNTDTDTDTEKVDKLNKIDTSGVPSFNPKSVGLPTIQAPEPAKLDVAPDYSTSFCRPRETTTTSEKIQNSAVSNLKNAFNIEGISWVNALFLFLAMGGVVFLLILWYTFKNPDMIGPFMIGIFRITWRIFIYFLILSVIVLFIQFIYYFSYWVGVTIDYFNLFMNPLLNERVSQLSCYFSDNVNFLIYYPAMAFYLFLLILVVLFDILILLPVMGLFGFFIGILFSLLGEPPDNVKKVLGTVSEFVQNGMQKMKTGTKDTLSGIMGKFKSPFSSIPVPVS